MPHDAPPSGKTPDPREMYNEISALVAALAKTFAMKDAEAAQALESGAMALDFAQDANGNRFVAATYEGKTARVYQGAIKRPE
jgi:hypothetical protein